MIPSGHHKKKLQESLINTYQIKFKQISSIIIQQTTQLMKQQKSEVFGPDTRTIVPDPHPAIKLLNFKTNGIWNRGTAFFIAPNLLLTAAHNLFNKDQGINTYCQNFEFPILYKNQEKINIKKVYVSEEYKNAVGDLRFRYDYGIIQTYEIVDTFLKIDWNYDGNFQDLNIVGYPNKIFPNGGGTTGQSANNQMYEAKGDCFIDELDHNLLKYKIPTSLGQSGSPVFYIEDNKKFVIGVHVCGDTTTEKNHAVLLTPSIREIINSWIDNQV